MNLKNQRAYYIIEKKLKKLSEKVSVKKVKALLRFSAVTVNT